MPPAFLCAMQCVCHSSPVADLNLIYNLSEPLYIFPCQITQLLDNSFVENTVKLSGKLSFSGLKLFCTFTVRSPSRSECFINENNSMGQLSKLFYLFMSLAMLKEKNPSENYRVYYLHNLRLRRLSRHIYFL